MNSSTVNLKESFLYQLFDKMDLNLDSEGTIQKQHEQQQKQHFHVLAVDDSQFDRKLLERLLTVSSYQVTCVDSGDKALEYLGLLDNTENDSTTCSASSCCTSPPIQSSQKEGLKVNLIMTDYSMPGMNGYDLLKRVKESSWKDTPVVVMSSENVPSRINMCLEGGAEQFLLKPVKLSDLRKLQSHLSLTNSCENIVVNSFIDDSNKKISNDNDDNKNNNSSNKRKAMSPECSERRPKMKLAVL